MFRKKCKSTSGGSILIALLFLLMCALAGSVVLTAASTSSGRLVHLKKDEQSYYSVLSAAKLLKKEIEGEKYSRYQVVSQDNELVADGYNEMPKKGMKEFLKKAADQVFESQFFYSDRWTIKASETAMEEVTAQFSMDTQYNITITFSQGNRECTLRIPAVLSENKEEAIDNESLLGPEIRKTTTLIWTEGEIQKK